jgi:hypothetical protein
MLASAAIEPAPELLRPEPVLILWHRGAQAVAVPASPSTVAKPRSRQLIVALMRSAPISRMRFAMPERMSE